MSIEATLERISALKADPGRSGVPDRCQHRPHWRHFCPSHGRHYDPSFWEKEGITPHRGRPLGELVRANFVSGGTMIVRAELRKRFHPLPDHAGWEDWWIAVRVAEVADLEYISEAMLRYRFHGANMNLGAAQGQALAKAAHEMLFRRWLLTDLQLDSVAPADLLVACRLYEHCVAAAAEHGGLSTHEVVPRGRDDGERVGQHVRAGYEALARSDVPGAMRAAARAFGHDVHDMRARDLLDTVEVALAREPSSALAARSGDDSSGAPSGERAARRRRAARGHPRQDVGLGQRAWPRDPACDARDRHLQPRHLPP